MYPDPHGLGLGHECRGPEFGSRGIDRGTKVSSLIFRVRNLALKVPTAALGSQTRLLPGPAPQGYMSTMPKRPGFAHPAPGSRPPASVMERSIQLGFSCLEWSNHSRQREVHFFVFENVFRFVDSSKVKMNKIGNHFSCKSIFNYESENAHQSERERSKHICVVFEVKQVSSSLYTLVTFLIHFRIVVVKSQMISHVIRRIFNIVSVIAWKWK